MRYSLLFTLSCLFLFAAGCEKDEITGSEDNDPEVEAQINLRVADERIDYPFAYMTDIVRVERDCQSPNCDPVVDFVQTLYLSTEDVLVNGNLEGTAANAVVIGVVSSSRSGANVFEYDFDFGFNWLPEGGTIATSFRVYEAYDFATRTSELTRFPQDGVLIYFDDSSVDRRAYMDVNMSDGTDIVGTWSGNPIRIE